MPHIQSFKGGIKHKTILSLAVPWPQIFFDEKKTQAEATVELAPRFLCTSDLVCDYLKFWPSEHR